MSDTCDPTPRTHDEIPPHIEVDEFHRRLEEGEPPLLLDVRTEEELVLARLDVETVHIPLHLLPLRVEELSADQEYAVICHTGVRSQQAVRFLRQKGISRARNFRGGIDLWSRAVDPRVPRY